MKVNSPESSFLDPASSFEQWMQAGKTWINEALGRALPPADTRPSSLHRAMRHACLGGGKRVRGLLALATAQTLGGDPRRALRPALALEIFHAYTLVHDDLPCMDDDDTRRGQPATHIAYGESTALLAGDALLTLACQWMAECAVPPPHPPGALVMELTSAGGSTGVIGGQVEDLAAESAPPEESRLLYIHTEKTARLLSCACRVGALCGGACASRVDALGRFGLHLGLAFQIQDDILDTTQDSQTLGKPAGSDAENEKLTSVTLWGLERARDEAARHTRAALEELAALDRPSPRLKDLTHLLLHRSY